MPRSLLGLPHSGTTTKSHSPSDLNEEENVSLIDTGNSGSGNHPPLSQSQFHHLHYDPKPAMSPSTSNLRRTPSPQPHPKVSFVNTRPRAKSLLGQSGGHPNNRLSLQICPPTPVPSCSAEDMNGHWSDQFTRATSGCGLSSCAGSGFSISSQQENENPESSRLSQQNQQQKQQRTTQIIYDDQVYDPLVPRLGHCPSPHFTHDRSRRKSFAKEALSLLYGLNPPPRTLSVSDFTEFDAKFPLAQPNDKENVRKSHHTDLNGPKNKNLSNSLSTNKLWGTDSAKNSVVYDNEGLGGQFFVDGGGATGTTDQNNFDDEKVG